MNASTVVVLVLLGAALTASAGGWWTPARRIAPAATIALLAAVAVVASIAQPPLTEPGTVTLLVVLAGALAVAGGGPVTSGVFEIIDRQHEAGTDGTSMRRAGDVLRGGAWIGALERAAVFASLVAGWPEGLALALALKGLGRYPELRNQDVTGAAERFIIGTFTSVLWAASAAGVVRLLT